MEKKSKDAKIWSGIRASARKSLRSRDYKVASLKERLQTSGAVASEVAAAEAELRASHAWIPGVRLLPRTVYDQLHRGFFSELGRQSEGAFKDIGFWPRQWATARMFADSAKGFHIHPPHVPAGKKPADWNRRFLKPDPEIPFEKEQWDVMFFIEGKNEFFLIDEREGLSRLTMRFFVGSDASDRKNNFAIVIPPGVAHALRVEGSVDAVMIYGTSVTFNPANEGRIASSIEIADLPPEWEKYLG